MSFSRMSFLAGSAVLGMTSQLPEAAIAAGGDHALMLTLWATTKDPDAFDKYYATTHDALVKKLPGLTSYEVSKGAITQEGSQPSPYHMISILGFNSMANLTAAIESPAGQAMVDDLKNFAAGTSVLFFSMNSA